MNESLEELKAIIDNAPHEAVSIFDDTYLDSNGDFLNGGFWSGTNGNFGVRHPSRSLSDIKEQIKLREMMNIAWGAIEEAGYEDFSRELRIFMEQ